MSKRIGIVAGLVVVTGWLMWMAYERHTFFDSRIYHGAMRYWFLDGGGMIYDWLRPTTPYGFTYPPFAGLVMAPMAFLPYPAVVAITCAATVLTTVLFTWWFVAPVIRRQGWTRWFAFAVAACLALSFEPVRETLTFGQVNTLLLAVVAGDVLFGVSKGRRWGGVGIGLATAVKLTPGIFILYLLVTRRWRAAATAAGTALGATVLAGAVFPDETREFWTSAVWDTNRVGVLSFVSNQSLRGFVARLPIEAVASYVWLALVLATLVIWVRRVRPLAARGDEFGGLALTGVVGVLVSPVSWVHHCVWLLPAIIRCVDVGLHAPGRRRQLYLGAGAYTVMTSHVLWLWEERPRPPLALIGTNVYVYLAVALFLFLPPPVPAADADPVDAAEPNDGELLRI